MTRRRRRGGPRRRRLLLGLTLAGAVASAAAGAEPAPATYVGGAACGRCHAAEAERWKGSHHDLGMQPVGPGTVRGRFDGAAFRKDGVTTTFSRRGERWLVRTDGPDGRPHDYPVAYTFGVEPLQQLLLPLPGGRFQALGIAWDTRPAAAGGQRWFDLNPRERIDHRDVLHWTGPAQNWNHMCAECHSTDVHKNYSAAGGRYETTWKDVDVSCEACHGPGSRHVAWAESARQGQADADPLRGLVFRLGDVAGGRWEFAPGRPIARRTAPLASRVEVETCGRCHSRRAQLWPEYRHGEPLAQTHRVALLDPGLYRADGQIEDEVYEYGSFLQSRMYAAGVTCSDCHDPHRGRLRETGNALCTRCHVATTYDGPQHHHHAAGSAAAACVACHMSERLYMVVDGRRDHSFRVPRPDLAERLGTPDACTACHTGKTARWAAESVAGWHAPGWRPAWHWGEALHAGRAWRADAEPLLLRAVEDPTVPAIARATAVSLLPPFLGPRSAAAIPRAAGDADALVRRAAAEALPALPPPDRVALGTALLRDPVRTVRLEALGGLLDLPRERFSADQTALLERVIAEYRAAQAFNADRADAQTNLGMLDARLGNVAAASAAFSTALRLQPSYVPAYIHLADLERATGREAEAEATLRRAARVAPDVAEVHEALGLSLVRQRRGAEALAELEKAAALAPDVPRHAWVYAVALHDRGETRRAIEVLERAHARCPGSRELLSALVDYEGQAGNRTAAEAWARQLARLDGEPAVPGR